MWRKGRDKYDFCKDAIRVISLGAISVRTCLSGSDEDDVGGYSLPIASMQANQAAQRPCIDRHRCMYESGVQTESELRRQIRSIEDELFDISLLHSLNIDRSLGQFKQLELLIKNERSTIELQILVDTTSPAL